MVTSGIVSHGSHRETRRPRSHESAQERATIGLNPFNPLQPPASPVTQRTEEVARMTQLSSAQLSRHCAGCSEERLFEQFHAEPASCPDIPDGECQEWGCTVCGDALIIGLPVPSYLSSDSTTRAA